MISILTCTYNREAYLPALYQSLKNQTSHNFEWVIIDDGSRDNTRELAETWMRQEKTFKISYYWQQNGGKHRAVNEGMKHVSGDWVFLVDSDDELTNDAIETAGQWIDDVSKETDAGRFAAVAGVKIAREGKITGGYPRLKSGQRYVDAKNSERKKRHLGGDKAEIYRTDILKKYPFPVFDNEKFLSEGAVWNKIALDGYQIRWYPKAIYLFEYLDGGLTNDDEKWVNNFKGFTYATQVSLLAYKGIYRIRPITKYIHYAKVKGITRNRIIAELNISGGEYIVGSIIDSLIGLYIRIFRM